MHTGRLDTLDLFLCYIKEIYKHHTLSTLHVIYSNIIYYSLRLSSLIILFIILKKSPNRTVNGILFNMIILCL